MNIVIKEVGAVGILAALSSLSRGSHEMSKAVIYLRCVAGSISWYDTITMNRFTKNRVYDGYLSSKMSLESMLERPTNFWVDQLKC
mmetsp:Transcript_27903/g.58938  ORF Transcript_27903/g.58938 Transcript_27903/m.58938 type:complete len:86 (-) Transcript_27903:46-303(-)